MATVLIVFVVAWSGTLTYLRSVAAKEKAGPGKPWFWHSVGLGWLHPGTPRGRKHAKLAVTLFWTGPVFLVCFLVLASLGGWWP